MAQIAGKEIRIRTCHGTMLAGLPTGQVSATDGHPDEWYKWVQIPLEEKGIVFPHASFFQFSLFWISFSHKL